MTGTPITSVAAHYVPPSDESDFVEWSEEVELVSRRFDGYLGKEIIVSGTDSLYLSIFRFNSAENLDVWMQSPERRQLLMDERSCYSPDSTTSSFRSLGFWFVPPDRESQLPSDHKMAFVTLATIWPLVHMISPVSSTFISSPWIAEFVSVAIIVLLMTYAVMPIVNNVLGSWLYRRT